MRLFILFVGGGAVIADGVHRARLPQDAVVGGFLRAVSRG